MGTSSNLSGDLTSHNEIRCLGTNDDMQGTLLKQNILSAREASVNE